MPGGASSRADHRGGASSVGALPEPRRQPALRSLGEHRSDRGDRHPRARVIARLRGSAPVRRARGQHAERARPVAGRHPAVRAKRTPMPSRCSTCRAAASGVASAGGDDRLAGRIPTEWYPTAVLPIGRLALGRERQGTRCRPEPGRRAAGRSAGRRATRCIPWASSNGTITVLPASRGQPALDSLAARVAHANGWDGRAPRGPTIRRSST